VALENEEAISCWRDVMKKEIRPSYASSNFSERNAVHGSDSPESAARELAFFGFGAKGASSEGWDA
jgi:nucleoside diphosphate kinase